MKRPAAGTRRGSLPLAEVARRWHVSRRAVRRLLQNGQLSFEQVNGRLRIPLATLERCEAVEQPAGGNAKAPAATQSAKERPGHKPPKITKPS